MGYEMSFVECDGSISIIHEVEYPQASKNDSIKCTRYQLPCPMLRTDISLKFYPLFPLKYMQPILK